ncbi:type II secretion system protein E [Acidimicrobium ferrooxidans DSM 10331]|uniref:Type II secretion system protein E n=1 Tax=Acidimicrobium ferrooxidans (strain DSM 10331 / JCM 15462 / NBRC 103882 / ICP) TaxID=525909 RepID=C7LZQ0_ACIFD|nr:ATPase, T2SS/T4P/T4SS family [Acidimicrobium ferrooxidans]ACU54208.1 type II secretion system protein E [Acidimicrobium ferrooxidans DSM 10331]
MAEYPWLDRYLSLCARLEHAVRAELDPAALPTDAAALDQLARRHALDIDDLAASEQLLGAVVRYVIFSMRALGPLEPLLADPDVEEISINAPREVWVRRRGRFARAPLGFYDHEHVRRALERLTTTARGAQRQLDPGQGIQDFTLADGSRVHVVHPELTPHGTWLVNIRRPLATIGHAMAEVPPLLASAVRVGATILIAGLPGVGKTTLARALLDGLDDAVRVVVAEEVGETRLARGNVAHLQTRRQRPGVEAISLRALVAASLRMTPERLVIGEVRDEEALPFVVAVASGIPGLSTIHAREPRAALERLATLAAIAPEAPGTATLRHLVADAIDLVVQLAWHDGPRVTGLVAVEGLSTPDGMGPFVVTNLLAPAATRTSRLFSRFPQLLEARTELVG